MNQNDVFETQELSLAPSTHEAVMARAQMNAEKRRQQPESIKDLLHAEDAVWISRPIPLPIEKVGRRRMVGRISGPRLPRHIEVPTISNAERQRRLAINNAAWAFPELYAA